MLVTGKWIKTSFITLSVAATLTMATASLADPAAPVIVQGDQQTEQTAFERIFWNKTPMSVSLKRDKERLIHFPAMVRVKPPEGITAEQLKITVIDNVVYLKALKDFKSSRMRVQAFNNSAGSFDGGKMYLVDISASGHGGTEPVQIVDKAFNNTHAKNPVAGNMMASQSTGTTPPVADPKSAQAVAPQVNMVDLVRFASQQLYAPERLAQKHPDIYRTALRVKTLPLFYRGGELESTPLASWKGGGLYVTAVKIQNKTNIPLVLDPRKFRGQWRSRTLQHTVLSQYQADTDTTTVYLVSDRPFHESLWF